MSKEVISSYEECVVEWLYLFGPPHPSFELFVQFSCLSLLTPLLHSKRVIWTYGYIVGGGEKESGEDGSS